MGAVLDRWGRMGAVLDRCQVGVRSPCLLHIRSVHLLEQSSICCSFVLVIRVPPNICPLRGNYKDRSEDLRILSIENGNLGLKLGD